MNNNLLAIWGVHAVVHTWKSPQSPTIRLRANVKRHVDSPDIYALATATSGNVAAIGVVGLKRTVILGEVPEWTPEITATEQAMLERLHKTFAIGEMEIGWVPLDLSKDKVGFSRIYVRNEFPELF